MTNELVTELREAAGDFSIFDKHLGCYAADEIERLETELLAATIRIDNDAMQLSEKSGHAQELEMRIAQINACWEEERNISDELAGERDALAAELRNIVHAKRYDRGHFESDTVFADWAQSRASFTLSNWHGHSHAR